MHSIQFWKSWQIVYQRVLWATVGVLILSLLFLWSAYFKSPAPSLTWQYIQEQELLEVPVHSFQTGLFDLTITGDNYIIFERMLGNDLTPDPVLAYLFLAILMMSTIMLVAVITSLSRFWYSIGMGLFILFIVGFRLELLQFLGFANKLPTVIVLMLYLPVSFYFHAFNTSVSFINRLAIFAFITVFAGAVLIPFSEAPVPAYHLAASGYIAAIILSVVFILMVAHEILASFVTLVSKGFRQTKSLNHFLLISLIYMVNLFLAYANKINLIEWDYLAVNFFLLLTISGILGIWGFRQRQAQYQGIIEADPFGVYLYVSLACICFASIAWFLSSANDPALDALRDVIIYSHLGYGIIFILYVLSNFMGMLARNIQVYRVLYQPSNMPYFTFRFAGLIATLAFVFYNTWQVPVRNAQAGYYNAMADIYKSNSPKLAEAYYTKAGMYGFQNHHANYAIANLEANRGNDGKESAFYKRASGTRPTEMSYLNWANTFQRKQSWLEALLTLRESSKDFPKSGVIKNSLGLLYANLNILDSALFLLEESRNSPLSSNSAETNIIGLVAKNNLPVNADSLYNLIGSTHAGVEANALALANQQDKKIKMQFPELRDSAVNLFFATLLNNYLINHLGEVDSTIINQTLKLARLKSNSGYSEQLLFACALSLYADGQIGRAFSLLEEVIFTSNTQGKYNAILALWALEQDAPDVALRFLTYVISQNFTAAALTNAIALSEAGQIGEAIVAWDSLKLHGDTTQLHMAENILRALALPEEFVGRFTDTDKYQYCRYRIDRDDSTHFIQVVTSIKSDDLKAKAIIDRTQKLLKADDLKAADQVFQKMNGLKMSDKSLFDEFKHTELKLLAEKRDFRSLETQMKETSFGFDRKNERIYFEALIDESKGDMQKSAKNYHWLATANPYFDEAIVASAKFYKAISKERLKAYNILVNALQVNPRSVKILKAYGLEAFRMGFDEYSQSAFDRLEGLIGPQAFRKFISENRKDLTPQNN
jgi:hypothetical protein